MKWIKLHKHIKGDWILFMEHHVQLVDGKLLRNFFDWKQQCCNVQLQYEYFVIKTKITKKRKQVHSLAKNIGGSYKESVVDKRRIMHYRNSQWERIRDDHVSCDAVNTRRSPSVSGLQRVKFHFEGELPNLQ